MFTRIVIRYLDHLLFSCPPLYSTNLGMLLAYVPLFCLSLYLPTAASVLAVRLALVEHPLSHCSAHIPLAPFSWPPVASLALLVVLSLPLPTLKL